MSERNFRCYLTHICWGEIDSYSAILANTHYSDPMATIVHGSDNNADDGREKNWIDPFVKKCNKLEWNLIPFSASKTFACISSFHHHFQCPKTLYVWASSVKLAVLNGRREINFSLSENIFSLKHHHHPSHERIWLLPSVNESLRLTMDLLLHHHSHD